MHYFVLQSAWGEEREFHTVSLINVRPQVCGGYTSDHINLILCVHVCLCHTDQECHVVNRIVFYSEILLVVTFMVRLW